MPAEEDTYNEWSEVALDEFNPYLGMTLDQLVMYQLDFLSALKHLPPDQQELIYGVQQKLSLVNTALTHRQN